MELLKSGVVFVIGFFIAGLGSSILGSGESSNTAALVIAILYLSGVVAYYGEKILKGDQKIQ